jgi:hypothetical protein
VKTINENDNKWFSYDYLNYTERDVIHIELKIFKVNDIVCVIEDNDFNR